jgi:hypothetical protein
MTEIRNDRVQATDFFHKILYCSLDDNCHANFWIDRFLFFIGSQGCLILISFVKRTAEHHYSSLETSVNFILLFVKINYFVRKNVLSDSFMKCVRITTNLKVV